MRFLSKIRERQFAKKCGGTYNLSRAVLAGVLAAGCLMPGFAEAAKLETWPENLISKGLITVDLDEDKKIVTIKGINNDELVDEEMITINWLDNPGESVEGCTINVKGVNSTDTLIITPKIAISGGYVADGKAKSNTVNISNVKFENRADIFGGCSGYPYSGEFSAYGAAAFSSGDPSGDGTVTGNTVTIEDTTFKVYSEIYGGYTSGDGTVTGNTVEIRGNTKSGIYSMFSIGGGFSASGTAEANSVIIKGGTFNSFISGGISAKAANGNSVIISGGNITGRVCGGLVNSNSDTATADDNSVIISGGTINGYVYGGYAFTGYGTANDNKVILVGENAKYPLSAEQTIDGGNITINGTVYGSNFDNSTTSNNEIHVYGSNIKVGHIAHFDNLNFYINNKMTYDDIMLKITGEGVTDISESNVSVNVDGAPQAKGDLNTITLIQKTDEDTGSIIKAENTNITVNFGPALTGTGSVALTEDQKDLVLTLKNITVNENGKSLVETRAAAAFVVNNMSDFMLGQGMEQAKAAAGGVTPIDAGTMAPFAAVGGSNMRYTTGSYVDVNGWNGAVGFAKQADKLLFGVAVEHGRGNYDSYLDNGVHASGDIKSTGGVIFGEYKLDNGVHYDAALRAGRVKSDYNSTATSYDESSAYYGFSLGGGKELTVSDKATLDVYGRYYFSHTNGSDVSIATGEEIDFDAVNSHRLRIGGRYTTTLTEKSKAYAGLAWQYEFGGDAKAAINGYSAPTPSLQGHSAIVEAGYKLNAGKNLTLDFNLNGAMGKQRGIGGGIGAQWLF